MKKLLITTCLSISTVFAVNYSDKVPGKDYTYREYLINRAIINKIKKNEPQAELKGAGMDFYGNVSIKKEEVKSDNGGWTTKKSYEVYIRNCGKIKLPEKDKDIMDKLRSGTRVKLKLQGSSCSISDWEIF